MSRLNGRDYQAVLAMAAKLHACADESELPHVAIDGLHEFIGAHRICFEHIAPSIPEFWGIAHPHMDYRPAMWQIFADHLDEQPGVQHYLRTGDPTATCLADFNTSAEWRRTQLYQRLLRDLGGEEQMGIVLDPPGPTFHAVILWRDRRTFTERDRLVLNLIRPHVAQAYANLQTLGRVARNLARHEAVNTGLGHWVLAVDGAGRLLEAPPAEARRQLEAFFGGDGQRPGRVPEPVAQWIARQWRRPGRIDAPPRPLVQRCDQRRLILRLLPAPGGDGERRLLVIEQSDAPGAVDWLHERGLTRREIQVLAELERGKSNVEIAKALFISPGTVKKHLEHVFEKLGVTSRTAALALLHRGS